MVNCILLYICLGKKKGNQQRKKYEFRKMEKERKINQQRKRNNNCGTHDEVVTKGG